MKIAVLGVGRLGAFHAQVLREMTEVSEVRVYDADRRVLRTYGRRSSSPGSCSLRSPHR